jgi:cytoskeletal protein CcmA (bactofilin family)
MSEQVTNFHQRSAGSQEVESVIGPTLVIKGEVYAEEDLLIMGRVEGMIEHNETLSIHADGSVKATIKAKEVQIDGTVDGDIFGSELVSIQDTAKVEGNIFTPRISITEGAYFKGGIDMDEHPGSVRNRIVSPSSDDA